MNTQIVFLLIGLISVSILAGNPCDQIQIHPSPVEIILDKTHPCRPDFDGKKNRIVIRKPGYLEISNNYKKVAYYEMNNRSWCGPGGHYYIDQDGIITKGRPDHMQGSNEFNAKAGTGNKNLLGVQVLFNQDPTPNELSEHFKGNFSLLIACLVEIHRISPDQIRSHFHTDFHPGEAVEQLVNNDEF